MTEAVTFLHTFVDGEPGEYAEVRLPTSRQEGPRQEIDRDRATDQRQIQHRGCLLCRQELKFVSRLACGAQLSPSAHDHTDQERCRQSLQRRLARPAAKRVQRHAGLPNRRNRLVDPLAGRSEGLRGLVGD